MKKALFEKLEDGRLIRYYLKRVMKELPDKEIFVQLSALNYEKRVTHTHLVFDTNGEFFRFGEKSIIFDRAMDFELEKEKGIIRTFCTVKTDGKTGVEMEALTGVNVALLTIYDMCKAVDKGMEINEVHLLRKSGGKSGVWERQ